MRQKIHAKFFNWFTSKSLHYNFSICLVIKTIISITFRKTKRISPSLWWYLALLVETREADHSCPDLADWLGVLIWAPIFLCWKLGQVAIHQRDVTVSRLLVSPPLLVSLLWRNQGHRLTVRGPGLANTFLSSNILSSSLSRPGWGKILVNKEHAGMSGGSRVCERNLICLWWYRI